MSWTETVRKIVGVTVAVLGVSFSAGCLGRASLSPLDRASSARYNADQRVVGVYELVERDETQIVEITELPRTDEMPFTRYQIRVFESASDAEPEMWWASIHQENGVTYGSAARVEDSNRYYFVRVAAFGKPITRLELTPFDEDWIDAAAARTPGVELVRYYDHDGDEAGEILNGRPAALRAMLGRSKNEPRAFDMSEQMVLRRTGDAPFVPKQ